MKLPLSEYIDDYRRRLEGALEGKSTMTPLDLASNQVGRVFQELPTDDPDALRTLKFLDPAAAAGTGIYGAVIVDCLFHYLSGEFETEEACYNHIFENQLWMTDNDSVKCAIVEEIFNGKAHIIQEDSLNKEWNMDFDVAVGNLPFQKDTGSTYAEAKWPDFLHKIFNTVKEGGYVSLIHPSGWRTPHGEFEDQGKMLMNRDMLHLNVNTREDGVSVFGATTSYDWYVLKNRKVSETHTTIEFVDKTVKENVDITRLPMIPNEKLDEVLGILATDGEETVEFIHDWSAYEAVPSRNEHMSHEETNEHCYPVVYTVTQGDGINLKWSSTNENGHFGNSKVIWSNGTSYPVVDENGEYGLTQFAYGIKDDPETLPKIAEAMKDDEFLNLMKAVKTVGHKYDRKVMSILKKDFWKEFV